MTATAAEAAPGTEPQGADSGKPPSEPPTNPPAAPAQDDETDWKAEARKWESRAKENSAAKKRLDELEEAAKTDLEKATSRAEAAERRAAELEALTLRREVAEARGLPLAAATRLTGTTREELEADADQLAALIGQETNPSPRPDPIQGRTRGGDAMSPRERLARQIMTPGAS